MKVECKSINEVLSINNSSFFIPPFQRAYAWGSQEIERYYADISRIIESERDISQKDKQEHFFGVLVFKPEDEGFALRQVVVDGQQRLTTTLLMLIALRDFDNDEMPKNYIENTFLKNPASSYSEKIKLKQVTSDWNAYTALIKGETQIDGKLTDGYNLYLAKLADSSYTTMEYINALKKVNVACIFLDERPHKGEDPQIIFETLNSLGKPLLLADLIRNYIMLGMPSSDQTESFETIWHPKIEKVFKERSSHFFRDYLQYKKSKYYKVVSDNNTKELYAIFTEFVKETFQDDKKAFIADICRYVPIYQWIHEVNPYAKISNNKERNRDIIELLRNIFHDIKADAFKPLVLGILEYHQYGFENIKLSDEQLIEALSVIRTYLIRRRVLRLTQGENKEIARLCDKIKQNDSLQNDAKSEMFRLLSKGAYRLRMPNNVEITNELIRIDFYNGLKKYSKLILGKIEEHISKVSVDFRDKAITIEHIMPQSIENSSEWKNEIGDGWEEIHKTYLHNIGNLILTEFNNEMGNNSLQKKKEKLSKSNLQYRNDILNRATWNIDDIDGHQKEMINRFLEVFPLPENMQKTENWDANNPSMKSEVFSPLEEDVDDIATNRKPKTILINDELFEISTWQDAYLSFLRWLDANNPIAFSKIVNQSEGGLFSTLVVTKTNLASIIEETPAMKDRYKRLSDGVVFSQIQEEVEENPIYVFINQSAQYVVLRIRYAMEIADMDEESVTVELKEIKAQ
jgi:uncharacterized protein with ParB-like and HNH nuclease domain